jgi:hypothetical protein
MLACHESDAAQASNWLQRRQSDQDNLDWIINRPLCASAVMHRLLCLDSITEPVCDQCQFSCLVLLCHHGLRLC